MSHKIPSLSTEAQKFRLGKYQHYKGDYYIALYIGRIEDTHEECVIYKAEYGNKYIWVRPLSIFTEHVNLNDKTIERFKYIT